MQDFYHPLRQAAHAACKFVSPGLWTVQGFGMMRMYLDPDKVWRLNVWHTRFMVPNVSVIHTHPWHFDSWIIAGMFHNQRYSRHTEKPAHEHSGTEGMRHVDWARIMTGIASPVGDAGQGGVEKQAEAWLIPRETERYTPGDYYHQDADEVHETVYSDFCVTINRRTKVGDGEHADVFWPHGTPWVSAKPRHATHEEVSETLAGISWHE